MGYPVEKIDKETALYVYIGPNAIEENRQESFNRYFKGADINATLMPLNIREDDLGFFIHNFKNSKINAAYFAREYWPLVATLLQSTDTVTTEKMLIDSLIVNQGAYEADFAFPEAVVQSIARNKPIAGSRIAIVGASYMTEMLVGKLAGHKPTLFKLYDETIENLVPCEEKSNGITTDINRVQDREVDVRDCDIVIDTLGRDRIISNSGACCVSLAGHISSKNQNNSYTLQYDDIFDTMAEIKTREWINNGRI